MVSKGLLTFDIDGTLTHRLDWIDPKMVQALAHWSSEGWDIALLTGRIFSFAWNILKEIKIPYYLGVQNGADILQMPSKKLLKRQYFSGSIVKEIEALYEGQEGDFIIYAGIDKGDFCYYRPEKFSQKTLDYLKVLENLSAAPWQPSNFHFSDDAQFPLIKCFGAEQAMKNLNKKLKNYSGIEVSMIHDPIDTTLYLNLITHPKAHKGCIVHFLKEHLKSPVVIAAGDDRNDIGMLKEADIAIAIKKAPQEVLDEADIIAGTADELGIIAAVEEAIVRASR